MPVQVQGLTTGVTAIVTGDYHTCAIANGGVQCWGKNGNGQLGSGSTSDSLVPVQVQGLTTGVTAIVAGDFHTCAIANGGVQCWGENGEGQLGDGSKGSPVVPVQVQGLTSGVTAIAAGMYHSCAVANGQVQCWGANWCGQLGSKPTVNDFSLVPLPVLGLTTGVAAIAGGNVHTCAVVSGGAKCWGSDEYGQLGSNAVGDSQVPVEVLFP